MGNQHEEGGIRRQNINAYNVFVLCFLGLGSITYGYSASIIGTTLGQPSFIECFDLGYSPVKQLLFPAAWLTFAFGMNEIAMFFVDRFPRNGYFAFGVFGCMATLIVEAALVANFVPSTNQSALQTAVAMYFVFQVFYSLCLDGTQFAYLGEMYVAPAAGAFPLLLSSAPALRSLKLSLADVRLSPSFQTHLRAKGVCLADNTSYSIQSILGNLITHWIKYFELVAPGNLLFRYSIEILPDELTR